MYNEFAKKGVTTLRNGLLYHEELEELRTAYIEMRERKSEQSGSAYGEHYLGRGEFERGI